MMKNKEKKRLQNFFIEDLSPDDFETTVNKFSKEIEKKTWMVSNVYDLQKTLNKHGKDVYPVKVFSLCHPNHSGKILEKDSERIITSMMPCRVSIYEKSDGHTYISRMNSVIMASNFGGIIEQVMTNSAKDVEDIIKNTLRVN